MYDDMWSETQNLGNWSGLLTCITFHLAKSQSDLKKIHKKRHHFLQKAFHALSCGMVCLVPTVSI